MGQNRDLEEQLQVVLNQEQLQVIANRMQHQLVIAPAGTGKTTAISEMVSKLCLEEEAKPSDIMCITFTNRAKNEMLGKIRKHDIEVRTMHSLYYKIIQLNAKRLGYSSEDVMIVGSDSADSLAVSIASKFELPERYALKIYLFCKVMFRESPNYRTWSETLCYVLTNYKTRKELGLGYQQDFESWLKQYGVQVVSEFSNRAILENIVDFGLLEVFVDELSKDKEVVEQFDRFRYLVVDEIQDTTKTEYDILMRLFSKAKVSLFGDFNQTIYTWRGSDPNYIMKEFNRLKDVRTTNLIENFRSDPKIVYYSQDFLDHFRGSNICELLKTPEDRLTVELAGGKYAEKALEYLDKWKQEDPLGRYAVLARNRGTLDSVKSAWMSDKYKGVNHMFEIGLPHELEIGDTKSMRLFREIVGVAAQPYNEFALNRLFQKFNVISQDKLSSYAYLVSGQYQSNEFSSKDCYEELYNAIQRKTLWVMDFETTAKEVESARIVQVCAKNPMTKEVFSALVTPNVEVGESEKIHGYTDRFLADNGADLQEVLRDLTAKIDGCVIAGHNVWYDLNVYFEECSRCGMKPARIVAVYDTMVESKRLLHDVNIRNLKLDTVRDALGINVKATHDAIDDVNATCGVLAVLIGRYITPQREELATAMKKDMKANKYAISQLKYLTEEVLRGEYSTVLEWCQSVTESSGVGSNGGSVGRTGFADGSGVMEGDKAGMVIGNPKNQLELEYLEGIKLTAMSPRCKASELYTYLTANKSEFDDIMYRNGKIPAITIHQSKGCEFDGVVLLDADIPFTQFGRSSYDDLPDEEMRVFYVGLTRARKKLVIVSNAEYPQTATLKLSYFSKDTLEFRSAADEKNQSIFR